MKTNCEKIIHTMGCNNCGGRCIIDAHVQNGTITKITTDKTEGTLSHPPLCACARGLNYHKTYLGSDRLTSPLLRVGERGSGEFVKISWDEAIDRIASEWVHIRDTYGPGSRYVHYGWGVSAVVTPLGMAKRLLALDGGYLDYYNSYSTACTAFTTPFLYGTNYSGNSYQDILNSHLIILWGHNPAETRFDTMMFYLKKAKEKGISIICVDPRYSDTAKLLDAEWIPLKPTTDAALMDAMAYVIVENNIYDNIFISKCCQGFTKETMPTGYENEECYFDYLEGKYDGIKKTPEWAERITGVKASVIENLAKRYATANPAALIQGYGPQRNYNGEQTVRGGIALACLTGNVGVSGGWACGTGYVPNPPTPSIPKLPNPYKPRIPVFCWTKAVEDGIHMGEADGVTGLPEGGRLSSNIKMLLNLAGNALINQHGDINRTAAILRDTSKCEFIVCSDLFMTPSAKFADIVLPAVSFLEMNNITTPWVYGDFIGCNNKVVEPLDNCRFEYDWLKEIARRLELYDEFTAGHETVEDWLYYSYETLRRENEQTKELPTYDKFRKDGIYRYENLPIVIAFERQHEDIKNNPFPTQSGRVEIFSPVLFEKHDGRIPGIPKYIPAVEGPEDLLVKKYPLQMIGYHTKRRCHSIHDNNQSMEALDSQAVHMNLGDAAERNISEGDMVRVFNDRGSIVLSARVSDRIMKGVAAVPQGAWYTPAAQNESQSNTPEDIRGNINVLTSQNATPLAKGNAQHTNLVEIAKINNMD